LFGLKGTPTKSLPQGDASRVKDLWDQYKYVNPGMEFDGLNPTQAELDAAGKDYKKYGHDDPRRIYARFNAQKRWTDFDDYLIKQYIPNQGNDPRGEAFEKKVVKGMGLAGPDWICQKEVYFTEPDTGERHKRVLDAYNKKTREIVEMKSNGKPDGSQTRADKAWARHKGWKSYKYTFVFGEQQKSEARTFMKDMKQTAGKDALGRDRVREVQLPLRPRAPGTQESRERPLPAQRPVPVQRRGERSHRPHRRPSRNSSTASTRTTPRAGCPRAPAESTSPPWTCVHRQARQGRGTELRVLREKGRRRVRSRLGRPGQGAAAFAHQPGILETDEREVEHTVGAVVLGEAVAEIGQHAVVEAGIVQLHGQRVFEVDAAADRLSGLPVRQVEQELQYTDGGQLSG
jgi:hypothetical protein